MHFYNYVKLIENLSTSLQDTNALLRTIGW